MLPVCVAVVVRLLFPNIFVQVRVRWCELSTRSSKLYIFFSFGDKIILIPLLTAVFVFFQLLPFDVWDRYL